MKLFDCFLMLYLKGSLDSSLPTTGQLNEIRALEPQGTYVDIGAHTPEECLLWLINLMIASIWSEHTLKTP